MAKLGAYPAAMARFLFATWEGGGHVQPMLLVAKGLMAQGHAALVVSDACNATDAGSHGVPFQAWPTAPSRTDRTPESDPLKDWLAGTPAEVIQGILDGMICGPALRFAADTMALIDAFRPDVVVVHELMFGVMAGAEARHVKLAVFSSNVWSLPTIDAAPPFGAGVGPAKTDDMRAFYRRVQNATRCAYQEGLPAYNAMRAELGLAPLADLFDQLHAAGRILIATSRAFDFDQDLPEPYRYVGPYFEDPPWTEDWTPPWAADDARPLVLVSFSTMYQRQEIPIARALEALGRLPVRGVVTLGPVLSVGDFTAPQNVLVTARAPHAPILPLASAVVTHAGHASALRPLMAGAPVVAIPLGRDQPDNAVRIAERGAGLRLDPGASADDIAAAVQRVIEEPGFREAAAALGARITADCEGRSAERELAAFAEEKRP
ncbi:MAG TPA: glycosyltransferase [Caulobacteraceae bacterium]